MLVDCQMGEWEAWGACSLQGSCGHGSQSRRKYVTVQCQNGGSCDCMEMNEDQACGNPCSKLYNIQTDVSIYLNEQSWPEWIGLR